MTANARWILQALSSGVLKGIGTEAGKDFYEKTREFISSLSESEQQTLSPRISFRKPSTFVAFDLARVSTEAASALLKLPPAERTRLVDAARTQASNDEQALLKLLQLALANK